MVNWAVSGITAYKLQLPGKWIFRQIYRFDVVFVLAVEVTASEKALGELKIKQNYTKNSISQTKLNDLANLDIEEKT